VFAISSLQLTQVPLFPDQATFVLMMITIIDGHTDCFTPCACAWGNYLTFDEYSCVDDAMAMNLILCNMVIAQLIPTEKVACLNHVRITAHLII
jgi:hypothetical protein